MDEVNSSTDVIDTDNDIKNKDVEKSLNEELKNKIKTDLIIPAYYKDIKSNLSGRYSWKTIGDVSDTAAKILSGCSTILAFSAGFFSIQILPFLSGMIGVTSLVCLQFSSYSMKESKERTTEVNLILNQLDMSNIVDTAVDSIVNET